MADFENIIEFDDTDFDEDELFSISTTSFDIEDTTTEVVVPDEIGELLDNLSDDDDDLCVLDQIPEISIRFVSDERTESIEPAGFICKVCNKKYKRENYYEKHISLCKPNKEKTGYLFYLTIHFIIFS